MDEELKKALAELGMSHKEAIEAQAKALKDFREESEKNDAKRDSANDEKLAKITQELDKFEKLNEAIQAAEARAKADEDARKELQEGLDRIEARLNRPGGAGENEDPEAKKYADAFYAYVRHGDGALANPERVNVLQVSDDAAAGYLAPAELVMSILKGIEEISPMRNLVTTRRTSRTAINWPKRTGLPEARFVGETEERKDTEGLTFGMFDIQVHESIFEVPISNWMLEDDQYDIEAEIREAVSLGYGRQEGRVIISGTGNKQPEGFLNAPDTIVVNTGVAADITADNLIDLKYGIKTGYARNGSYIMNRQTLGKVRKMKDGNGQYLWASGLAAGRANTIDGEPYSEMPDMPNVGAGLKPVAFGDWKRAYVLVDRVDMSVLYDPYTLRKFGQVAFSWRRRFGGRTVLGEAISTLRVQQ